MNTATIKQLMAFGTFDFVLWMKRTLRQSQGMPALGHLSSAKGLAAQPFCGAWVAAVQKVSGLARGRTAGKKAAGKTKRANLKDWPVGNLVAGAGFEPTTFGL